MPPMAVRRYEGKVRVRSEDVPVLFVEPEVGPARDLVFLHGYARHPLDYIDLLEAVARGGRRVVAPFLFCNNGLRRPPRHFWACAALARRTLESLRASGDLADDAPVFGHSTGGAVAYAMGRLDPPPPGILAFNPVQPSRRPPVRFMLASAWMNTKMTLGLAGGGAAARRVLRRSAGRFYVNWLRNPVASYALIGGLRAFDYPRLRLWYEGRPSPVPVRAVWGAGDEFYPHTRGLESGLREAFQRASLTVLDDENSHEWMMFRVDRASALVEEALGGG